MKITITLTHKGKLKPKDKREALEIVQLLAEEAVEAKLRDFKWMPRWIQMKSRVEGGR